MDRRCIVFYDSGAGGLNLFERTRKAFPSEDYVYYADGKNMPFGDKAKDELIKIFEEDLLVIKSFCPKMLVIACNTMSCVASCMLREIPFQTVCVLPFLPVIENPNKSSGCVSGGGKGLLLTTPATAETDYVKRLVKGRGDVILLPQKTLAKEVEAWIRGGKKPDISSNFRDFSDGIKYVSLGCTHYGFLKKDFKKLFPKAKIISGEDIAFEKILYALTTSDNQTDKGTGCIVKP